MKGKNGFLLEDALFALFMLLICVSLLSNAIYCFYQQKDLMIHEKIETKWFYTD